LKHRVTKSIGGAVGESSTAISRGLIEAKAIAPSLLDFCACHPRRSAVASLKLQSYRLADL